MNRGDPWTSQTPARPDVVQVSGELTSKPSEKMEGAQETRSGRVSTAPTREPSLASPRLTPVPGSPLLSVQLPPNSCAPTKVPTKDVTNYDQLSYGQLREPRNATRIPKEGYEGNAADSFGGRGRGK